MSFAQQVSSISGICDGWVVDGGCWPRSFSEERGKDELRGKLARTVCGWYDDGDDDAASVGDYGAWSKELVVEVRVYGKSLGPCLKQ